MMTLPPPEIIRKTSVLNEEFKKMVTVIPAKELRVVRMTARMLVFTDGNGQEYFASKRVANEILSGSVDEVFVVNQNFFRQGVRHSMLMLATPSCW